MPPLEASAAQRARAVGITLLVLLAAVFFLWMPGEFLDGDPAAFREEARTLLASGGLSVDPGFAKSFFERGQYFVHNERADLWYSKFGVVNGLLSLPPLALQAATGTLPAPGRVPSLWLFNLWYLAMGVGLAALLYLLTARYSGRPATRALFVATAFFCTSLWFYQRAQASELYQTLLFTGFFMALVGFLRPLRDRGPDGLDRRAWICLALAWLCAAALVYTRLVYGLLLPIAVLLALYAAWQGRGWPGLRARAPLLAAALLLPPLAIVAGLALVNQVKFGAPWLTGYHQWRPDLTSFTGRLTDGLWGFLFSARFGVFFYFPLLAFALLGARRFAERHRLEAVAALAIFVPFLLVFAKLPSWAGEWSYGPRYLLPMLPVLALPFLAFVDDVIDRIATWRARAWAVIAIATLSYSAFLQVQVNRLPFWTYYNAQVALSAVRSPESMDYFLNHHTGVIADDLLRHRGNLDALPFFAELKRNAPEDLVKEYRAVIGGMVERGNLYWNLPPERRR